MRKLILLTLFLIGAAKVSADCTQADLAGWWELSAGKLSCSFLLDEAGIMTKGNCWQAYAARNGGKLAGRRSILNDTELNLEKRIESAIMVGEHCKVTGGLLTSPFESGAPNVENGEPFIAWLLSGRISLDKSMVSGTSAVFISRQNYDYPWPNDGEYFATYTLVKF